MPHDPDPFDRPDFAQIVLAAATRAVREAVAENARLGLASVGARDGKLVWLLPDGSIVDAEPGQGASIQSGNSAAKRLPNTGSGE